jgi:hypothetical protein
MKFIYVYPNICCKFSYTQKAQYIENTENILKCSNYCAFPCNSTVNPMLTKCDILFQLQCFFLQPVGDHGYPHSKPDVKHLMLCYSCSAFLCTACWWPLVTPQ